MKRMSSLANITCLAALALAPGARAAFGLNQFDVAFTDASGAAQSQAGVHPYEMTVAFNVNSSGGLVEQQPRDIFTAQAPGFVGNPTAVPPCSTADFLTTAHDAKGNNIPACPDSSAVGVVIVRLANSSGGVGVPVNAAVFNLEPPFGKASKLGFWVAGVPVTIELGVNALPPFNIVGGPTNISEVLEVLATKLTLWGVPADPRHDPVRGRCLEVDGTSSGDCGAGISVKPFLTLPRACAGPLLSTYEATSWQGGVDSGSALTHGDRGEPLGMTGCGGLPFGPTITARPTARATQSPSGLEFGLDVPNEGLENTADGAVSASDIKKTVVTLPPGMTINPSQAEGLEVCSESQLAREAASSPPGAGCPEASKIGRVEVESPLLEGKLLTGALFVAKPYENLAGDSMIAVYVVIREPRLGIVVRQPLRVEPDPVTGQLVTTAEDMPQLPFSHFRLRFREGGRAPLISPPRCGDFAVRAMLYPWSGGSPVEATSPFQIISGINGAACPAAATFDPSFEAGTLGNAAGRFSPFYMRVRRNDGEQDLTRFSAVLPRGVVGKLAGISYCPEAGIERARSRMGPHGGQEELEDPSCPAASRIGRTLAGAGIGSQLTHVPGTLYLAGPFGGDHISVVSITPAVAGPFDAGTVVVRESLRLNPVSGEVEVDGVSSDPIPRILKGIPLNVRDLRIHVDREEFTLNATSCAEGHSQATIWGGGTVLDPRSEASVTVRARYQAAGCRTLGFKPRLAIKLRGGTSRGAHPALRAVLTPRPGDANFSLAVVRLPHSAFLEQAHIRTICTRVQFAAGAGNGTGCPKGAIYGHARAWSPLLNQPLEGPVLLRSSNHALPDLVVALHGLVDINLAARIDSVNAGIRSTFTGIPDAPVSRFVLDMRGGGKGLIVNSRNLCLKPKRNRATTNLTAQNGRRQRAKPVVRAPRCRNGKPKRLERGNHK